MIVIRKLAFGTFGLIVVPVMILLVALHVQEAIPLDVLTRDAVATARLPFYTGALSNLGILFWAAATTLALFVGTLPHVRARQPMEAGFLVQSGCLVLLLLCDDLFLLHERVFPAVLGLSEKGLYVVYATWALVLAYLHWPRIWMHGVYLPAWIVACFALSVAIDVVATPLPGVWRIQSIAFEDTFKLLGVAGVLAYFLRVTRTVAFSSSAGTSAATP